MGKAKYMATDDRSMTQLASSALGFFQPPQDWEGQSEAIL